MGIRQGLDALASIVRTLVDGLVPPAGVGRVRPAATTDLPRVVLAVDGVDHAPAGIGAAAGARRGPGGGWVETRGRRWSGEVAVEAWAVDPGAALALSDALVSGLDGAADRLREAGFLRCAVRRIGAVEPLSGPPVSGARAVLGYAVIHEEIAGDAPDGTGVIRQVDVTMGAGSDVPAGAGWEERLQVRE